MRKLTLVFTLIIFSNHLFSKMNDCIVNYPLTFLIDEEDCNGDFNGNAYLDDCLNCVGGNTGQQPCVPLNPDVELNFSNNQCGALSDIVLDVSQSPNQPDMENLIITTTNGQYDFSSLSIGDVVGEAKKWIIGQENCEVVIWNDEPISVEAPPFVELNIAKSDPGIKGDTVSGATKPAELETGVTIQVPLFVEEGEKIKVDTRSGEYSGRV